MKEYCGFENLSVKCIVGTFSHERAVPQELLIDLKVESDKAHSGAHDRLEEVIDYAELASIAIAVAQEGQHHLLETIAHSILAKISSRFPIPRAWIRIRKPAALQGNGIAFVECEWQRTP